jgi:hypothetical protein
MTFGGLVWLLLSVWEQAVPSENAGERGMQKFVCGGLSVLFGLTVMAISVVSGMLWAVLENFLSTDGVNQGEPHGDGGQAEQSNVRRQQAGRNCRGNLWDSVSTDQHYKGCVSYSLLCDLRKRL